MKKNIWKITAIAAGAISVLLLLAVAVIGFNARNSYEMPYEGSGGQEKTMDMDMAADSMAAEENAAESSTPAGQPVNPLRKIIVTASLSLEVAELAKSMAQAEALANGSGGYVESSGVTTLGDASRQATMILRVPAGKFDTSMASLRKMAVGISNESVSRSDVTMEYVDMEARLKNLQEHENALRKMWDQAKNVEDLIKIEGELARVRGEIESLTAQKKVMENQIQLATITLTLTEEAAAVPSNPQGESLVKQAADAFVTSISLLRYTAGWLVIALSGLLPLLLIAAAATVGVRYLLKRRKSRKTAEKKDVHAE